MAEIKSQLTTGTIEQIAKQREAISAMRHTRKLAVGARFIVPHIVIAFESAVAPEQVWSWLKSNADLLSVCVVTSFSVDRTDATKLQQVKAHDATDHTHVLQFVFRLINLLEQVVLLRKDSSPALENYLLPTPATAEDIPE